MCEALFLISNPGKADSQLVALEYGWGVGDSGKVHSCKAYRATVLRTVCSTDSVRRVIISSGFRPQSSLGVLLLPCAVLWVNGRPGGPGCGQQLSTSTLDS